MNVAMKVWWCGAAALMLVLIGMPAQADDRLTLVFDGSRYEFVPVMEGARTGFSRFSALEAVSLEGVSREGPEQLVLQVSLPPGADASAGILDGRILFRPNGWVDYWVTPPILAADAIRIEALALSGLAPMIAGQFEIELCPVASPVRPPDLSRCVPASGAFHTELVRD